MAGGVLFVDVSSSEVDKAAQAIAFLYEFARSMGGKMATGVKIRALRGRFFLKSVRDGQKYEWEIKGIKGIYHARERNVPRAQ